MNRLKKYKIIDIAAGYAHSLCLDEKGVVWVCGVGLNGRLGLGRGAKLGEYPRPQSMNLSWYQHLYNLELKRERRAIRDETDLPAVRDYMPRIVRVAAGYAHSVFLTEDGRVWCCGKGSMGALGQGHDFRDKYWPTEVTVLTELGESIVDIQSGQHHVAVLTESGEVWTWGMSRHGQCGRPRNEAFALSDFKEHGEDMSAVESSPPPEEPDAPSPVQNDPYAMKPGRLPLPEDVEVYAIRCGWYQTTIITMEGEAITFGREEGRLGDEPIKMDVPDVIDVAHGWKHNIVVVGS